MTLPLQTITDRMTAIEKRLTLSEGAAGLQFFRADKDGDKDFDPLTAAAWEAGSPAATGTINWASAFAVPARARAVLLYVSGTISFKALSTTTNSAATTGEQRTVIISDAGTSYWSAAAGTVTVRVIGWWA